MNDKELSIKAFRIKRLALLLRKSPWEMQEAFYSLGERSIIDLQDSAHCPDYNFLQAAAEIILDNDPIYLYEWEVMEDLAMNVNLFITKWSYRERTGS